jgi:uncharacterized protein (TIGR03437 family)
MRRIYAGLGFFLWMASLSAQSSQGTLASVFSTRLSSTGASADTTPISTAIYNNYSFIPPGAPNHVVAQGSIIAIKGSLGPPQFSTLQQVPQAGFGGVTITVTVNNTPVQALNYYVGPQLAAVLPSNTPTGDGTFTVTYNGQTSAPAPVRVVQSSFGILTLDSSGLGAAKVCDYRLDKTCQTYPALTNSAIPGDTITLWGSGLGPTPSDAINVDMTKNTPGAQVWIGGQAAPVLYAGRSQFVGLDLINVTIPSGVQGCHVSVVVQIGNNVSNSTSLPIEPNGGACSDPVTGRSGSDLGTLMSQSSFAIGAVNLSHTTSAQGAISESANAGFYRVQPSQLSSFQQVLPQASFNSCTVWTLHTDQNGIPTGVSLPAELDAGTVTVTSNGSTQTLTRDATSGAYSANLGSGGFFTGTAGVSGTGGSDVGPFTVSMTAPSGFTWTNRGAVSVIARTQAQGQLIQWSNAASGSYVAISGTSIGVDASSKPLGLTTFTCIAPGQDGQFTIPSWVLEGVPPTSAGIPGSLSVSNYATPVSFPWTNGPDLGFLNFYTSSSASVTYQ